MSGEFFMKMVLRWTGRVLAVLILLLLLAAVYVYFASSRVMSRTYEATPEALPQPTAAQLADAPRQARILGCISCHGEGLKGDLMFEAPGVAAIWAPNLTEVAARSSNQQLAAAIRQGIGHDGRGLFVMPSGLYSRLSETEVAALIAFIRSQPKTGKPVPRLSIGPIGRLAVVQGKIRQQPERIEEFGANWPHELGPRYAAGRRIAATVCADCHMPDLLGGTMEDGEEAPNLSIAGAYDYEQFRTLMRTGKGAGGRELGLMSKISRLDLKYLTDAEIRALHDYLKARAERVTQ